MGVLPKSSEKNSEKNQNLEKSSEKNSEKSSQKSSEKTDVEILTRLAENPDRTISKLAEISGVTTIYCIIS